MINLNEIKFREAKTTDKEFILKANEEINFLSGINNDSFKERIDKDLFEYKICKSIIAEIDDNTVWIILYSYNYRANIWKWIYISQAYVKNEYRGQGIYKSLVNELKKIEPECKFFTWLIGPENEIIQIVLKKMDFKTSDTVTYYKKL